MINFEPIFKNILKMMNISNILQSDNLMGFTVKIITAILKSRSAGALLGIEVFLLNK